ncbi:MAG: SUMF1/EgtB/PvdO family nonheme iron enzyme, partial [Rikenellaceae bacterium]
MSLSAQDWVDEFIKVKQDYDSQLKKAAMPIKTEVVKRGAEPLKLAADLTGLERLYLITDPTEDGDTYDHTFWGNAKLTTTEGEVIFLDEMEFASAQAAYDIMRNTNFAGKSARIGSKTMERGVMCHAYGEILLALDGKFKNFEAEVGIDMNATDNASAIFIIQNISAIEIADDFIAKYPESAQFISNCGVSEQSLFTSINAKVEKSAVISLSKKLKDNSYFKKAVSELSGDENTQTKAAINLFYEVYKILDIQNTLKWTSLESIKNAYNDFKNTPGYDAAKYGAKLSELEKIFATIDDIYHNDPIAIENAKKVIDLSREIILSNPALDFDKILVSRYKLNNARGAMAPDLGTQANNWSNQESARREGFDADVVELSNIRGEVDLRTVYKPENSSPIADLRLHWDGERAMITKTQSDNRWNLFEIDLSSGECSQLIDCPEDDLEFYDGTYLPDGRLIATSNIGYQGVPCVSGDDPVGNMMIYNPENKALRRLTFDQDANWNPTINHEGKVMYTRWEYTDLTHYYSRIVMTMNPDGTEQRALYGSGSMFPNSTYDIQSLPNQASSFIGIVSGHHGIARSGRLVVFDPAKNRKGAEGMVQEIPYSGKEIKEEIKDELVNGVWPQFIKPFPINDKYFLVAAKLSEDDLWGVYLVDVFDNVTCIRKVEGEGYIAPIPVRKTQTPPSIPDRINLDDKEATIFIQDIYEGEGLIGVPRGTVKELRIFAYEYAYVKTSSDHNWHGIQSGWDIKRMLGTVPIEEDGSVIFKVPANTPISIQPIGYDGAAIQWMRSWFTAMPGEMVSCIGCHEDLNQIAMPKRVIASMKQASQLTPPEGGTRSFTFDLEVQPILDRACVACHNEKSSINFKHQGVDNLGYGISYLNLHPYVHRQGGEGDMAVLYPYEYHPNTSELVRMLKKGHYNVELTDKEWQSLYNWIDFNAPYKGYFNANIINSTPYKGYEQIERRIELTNKYGNDMGVDWKKEIEDYAKQLESKGEIEPTMPKPLNNNNKEVKLKEWPLDAAAIKEMLAKEESTTKVIDLGNGVKMNFVRIPSGKFIMGSNNGAEDAKPATKVEIKKSFWMGEIEVTNEQFNTLFPDHDSKFMDEYWKDHVDQGYPAFEPQQPVIRVSWENAMEYCRMLSEKTGLNITLPTEAQWEWACRAGSDSDFWYGNSNTDFGTKENLADKTTNLFAVWGVDPQPMSPSSYL